MKYRPIREERHSSRQIEPAKKLLKQDQERIAREIGNDQNELQSSDDSGELRNGSLPCIACKIKRHSYCPEVYSLCKDTAANKPW
ncbi:MAG: hypothetical protein HGA46_08175 [Chlorobiaceae bacterium]|nr:hypothetical protein [Chlorobiaceae bacterium]